MVDAKRCGFSGCERPAAASVATRPFCLEHFIITCYARLDALGEQMREQGFDDRAAESVRQFVHECVEQATNLAHKAQDLSNLVGRRLRRSPRKVAALPIRVRSERPGGSWEEETETRVLSRYGALIECRHFAQTGETLRILRLDKAEEAEARVAWLWRKESQRVELGVEFTSRDNFWGLDWGTAELRMATE